MNVGWFRHASSFRRYISPFSRCCGAPCGWSSTVLRTRSHISRGSKRFSPPVQWRLTLSFLQTGHSSALSYQPGQAVSSCASRRESSVLAQAAVAMMAQALGQAPRLLVLQRLQRTDEFTRWHHRSNLTEERVLTIARQVVRQTAKSRRASSREYGFDHTTDASHGAQATSTPVTPSTRQPASR